MKKITDLLKPNILIILGALLFLVYLNFLSLTEAYLAIGIIGVVFAAYYLVIGILGVIVGDKFSAMLKKVFDVVSACLFPVFIFIISLINVITAAQGLLPTGWIILILAMVGSLALAAIYPMAKFMNKPIIARFAYLFAAIFALVLLLNVLYAQNGLVSGAPNMLGDIDLIMLVIYIAYLVFLFGSLEKGEAKQEEPAPQEAPAPQEEEPAPQEEAPQE